MKKFIRILLAPFKAWVDAYDKSMSEVKEMDEPHRSYLIRAIFFPEVGA